MVPIGALIGLGSGIAGAVTAARGARRVAGPTAEELLRSLRRSNATQASQVAQSGVGQTPGQRAVVEGNVLAQMNARTDPTIAATATQLAQSETEAERRRRAVLYGGLGGSIAALGQGINMTSQAVADAPAQQQTPLQQFYGQGMKPEEVGVPMGASAAQGQPQANPMMQGLRQDFVQGTYGAAPGGVQPHTGFNFQQGGTPLIQDPNVAIPQTPILDQPMTSENANEQARAIFENVSGQQWREPAPAQRPQPAPAQPAQQAVPPPGVWIPPIAGPEGLTAEQRQAQTAHQIEAQLYQAIGRERNMLRRNQMITRYLRMQSQRGNF